jgi:hypothetical protein
MSKGKSIVGYYLEDGELYCSECGQRIISMLTGKGYAPEFQRVRESDILKNGQTYGECSGMVDGQICKNWIETGLKETEI